MTTLLVGLMPVLVELVQWRYRSRSRLPWWAWLALLAVGAVGWMLDRRRTGMWHRRVSHEVEAYPGARVRPARREANCRVDLPGPPTPAVVRWWTHPMLRGGRRERLRYTEFAAQLPKGLPRLWLSTEGFQDPRRPKAFETVRTGDGQFDLAYTIAAASPEWTRRVLDDVARDKIRALDALHSGALILDVRLREVVVRAEGRFEEEQHLQRFIAGCYGVVESLLESPPPMETEGLVVSPEGACPVCGTAIEPSAQVRCGACQTPHHDECWAYADGCSTFGCGSRDRGT